MITADRYVIFLYSLGNIWDSATEALSVYFKQPLFNLSILKIVIALHLFSLSVSVKHFGNTFSFCNGFCEALNLV